MIEIERELQALKTSRDAFRRASTDEMVHRRNLERRAIPSNFYWSWMRTSVGATINWYDAFTAPSDMILNRMYLYCGQQIEKYWIAVVPPGVAMGGSISGFNGKTEIVAHGSIWYGACPVVIDFGPAGVLVRANHRVQHTIAGIWGVTQYFGGRLELAASTPGHKYRHL